jgi:hypothetical protein
MAELVGVDGGHPGLLAATLQDLRNAAVAEAATMAGRRGHQEQGQAPAEVVAAVPDGHDQVRVAMLRAGPEVAAKGLRGRAAEPDDPDPLALAVEDGRPGRQVEVVQEEPGDLRAAGPGRAQEQEEGPVAEVIERPPAGRVEEPRQVARGDDRNADLRDLGPPDAFERAALQDALLVGGQPAEERRDRDEPRNGRPRAARVLEVGQEGLDVAAGRRLRVERRPAGGHE